MKKDRRWMKSILAAAQETPVALPFARGTRRRPAAFAAPKVAPKAVAAR